MKIQVVIPLWKRPEVTRFCFDGLLRLIKASKHEIKVLCVISEPEYEKVCEDYGFCWVFADNDPLGKKINHGIKCALFNDWDYLMMMNSDDIIDVKLLDEYYQPFFDRQEKFFGINKVTYVNFYTHEAREVDYGYSILGIGKCVHREVVERMNGNLYEPTYNRLLDDNMFMRIHNLKVGHSIVRYEGMLAMDFKSETNIWPWEHFKNKGKEVCYKPG